MNDSNLLLRDRVALVTGGAKRLGAAVASAMAQVGADVVIHYNRSADEAETLAEQLRQLGRRAWTVQGELTDPTQVDDVAAEAIDQAGRVDILINNASIFPESHVLAFSQDDLAENVQVNAMAPLQLARAVAGQEIAADIINLLDTRILSYDVKHAAYHLSKRMLATITNMLAIELAPRIRVNAIAPGLVLPPPGKDESYLDELAHTNPLNTHGCAGDIAHAALFLLTSPFVTGQVIYVDGGRHLKGRTYE